MFCFQSDRSTGDLLHDADRFLHIDTYISRQLFLYTDIYIYIYMHIAIPTLIYLQISVTEFYTRKLCANSTFLNLLDFSLAKKGCQRERHIFTRFQPPTNSCDRKEQNIMPWRKCIFYVSRVFIINSPNADIYLIHGLFVLISFPYLIPY